MRVKNCLSAAQKQFAVSLVNTRHLLLQVGTDGMLLWLEGPKMCACSSLDGSQCRRLLQRCAPLERRWQMARSAAIWSGDGLLAALVSSQLRSQLPPTTTRVSFFPGCWLHSSTRLTKGRSKLSVHTGTISCGTNVVCCVIDRSHQRASFQPSCVWQGAYVAMRRHLIWHKNSPEAGLPCETTMQVSLTVPSRETAA